MLKLYNTLTRQKEEFKPIKPPKVTYYSCGPTVYDFPHIGNWFTFIRYDLFNRVLRANGFDVDWVMNITDVGHLTSDSDEGEDKLEKGAKREGATAWEVAQKYTDYFEAGFA
jgi:cysteinyl-tRNA synthetase